MCQAPPTSGGRACLVYSQISARLGAEVDSSMHPPYWEPGLARSDHPDQAVQYARDVREWVEASILQIGEQSVCDLRGGDDSRGGPGSRHCHIDGEAGPSSLFLCLGDPGGCEQSVLDSYPSIGQAAPGFGIGTTQAIDSVSGFGGSWFSGDGCDSDCSLAVQELNWVKRMSDRQYKTAAGRVQPLEHNKGGEAWRRHARKGAWPSGGRRREGFDTAGRLSQLVVSTVCPSCAPILYSGQLGPGKDVRVALGTPGTGRSGSKVAFPSAVDCVEVVTSSDSEFRSYLYFSLDILNDNQIAQSLSQRLIGDVARELWLVTAGAGARAADLHSRFVAGSVRPPWPGTASSDHPFVSFIDAIHQHIASVVARSGTDVAVATGSVVTACSRSDIGVATGSV